MKKIFLLIGLLIAAKSYSQCGLNPNLSAIGGICLGYDTLSISGVAGTAKIVWKRNNIPFDTVTAVIQHQGKYVAGFGFGDLTDMLNYPTAVYVDRIGNIYIADGGSARIIKYTTDTAMVIAGGNGTGNAANQLNIPHGIYVDSIGNLYVADYRNNRVQKFPPGSTSATNGVTVAGGNGIGSAANQLGNPVNVCLDNSGNIYVLDYGNDRVQKFPPGSTQATNATTFAGGNGSGSAANQLAYPLDMCRDKAGNIYVADGNERIQKFPLGSNSTTNGITVAGGNGFGTAANQFSGVSGVFMDTAGNIFVADNMNSRIQKFPAGSTSATNGITVAGGNGSGNGANQFSYTNGYQIKVAVDLSGNIFVADDENNRVQKFPISSTSATNAATFSGGNGDGSDSIHFKNSFSSCLDKNGSIYVCDAGNNRVLKFPPGSTYLTPGITVAGGNGAGSAANQLSEPHGVFVDRTGNIYVADYNNDRVQKFPPGSNSSTNGVTIAGGNGYGAASTQFKGPMGLWVDSLGNVYVADPNNSRIQNFPPGSTSSTIGSTFAATGLSYPQAIVGDANGNIYVSDYNNQRIQKYPPGSTGASLGTTVAGGNGSGYAANQFYFPTGICLDASGNLYVSDYENFRIQKFPPNSTSATNAITVAGGNGQGYQANQVNAYSISLDSAGNMFCGEANRVMEWSQNPISLGISDTTFVPVLPGSYTVVVTTVTGCIDTSNAVFISSSSTSSLHVAICLGSSFSFNNQSLTAAGTYLDTLVNSYGCDSIVTLILAVNPPVTSSFNVAVCIGNSYFFNGQNLTVAGSYLDTLTTQSGCDSIVTLHLTVNSPNSSVVNASFCNGSSYPFNGQSLTVAGTYYDTLSNSSGCDSIITLHLSVNPVITSSFNAAICAGSFYSYNGQNLTGTGNYLDTLTAQSGCDSIVTLHLTVNSPNGSSLNASVCNGSSYPFNGQLLTVAGIYYDTLSNISGCDSIVTLHLSFNPVITSSFNAAICAGSSYFYNGQNLTVAGAYLDTLTSQSGCDSIVTLHLTVNQLPVVTLSGNPDTLCINGSAIVLTGGNPVGGIYSGNGVSSGTFTPAVAGVGSAVITYSYTDGNSCSNTTTENIVVNSCISHNCHAFYTLYPDTTTQHNWWAVNQATGSGAITYTWYWGDGTNSTGATPSHIYATAGNYNICLTISDSAGCTDTYCDSSTYVYKNEQTVVTVNCVFQLPNGINETAADAMISVYPNPATNQLFIETNGMAVSEINIYNTTGSLVSSVRAIHESPQLKSIDISQLANGIYLAELKTKEASVKRRWVKM